MTNMTTAMPFCFPCLLYTSSYVSMLNPVIIKTGDKRYTAEEGCLCHSTQKKALRYEKIKVSYMDCCGKKKIKTYEGFCAQIIQHELDHCDGILI